MGEARRVEEGRDESGRFKPREPATELTPHQIQILQYLAHGKRTEDIALLMNTSEPSITRYIVQIMDFTGTATRPSAVAWALRRGLIK